MYEKRIKLNVYSMFALLLVGLFNIFQFDVEFCLRDDTIYDKSVIEATYIDNILDYYGEDRYQYIGFVNPSYYFIGFTKHLPEGPIFVQDPDNLIDEESWFYKSFRASK